jgi:hypothetical protein
MFLARERGDDLPIDLNDDHVTDFELRRAEARADYEDRLITASEYQATVARIDQDEDDYFRLRAAGGTPDEAAAPVDSNSAGAE